MSNTVKLNTCPKCSAPIPLAAPQGLCPRCVLLGAATATEQGVPATATSEIPSIERIAKAFPQLEVLELIGRGGMGFVFKARQPHLDRFVALKLLPDKLAKDAQFAERFNREGRVLAKLNHPNIVSVFDFGQTGGFYYLTMEYVDGVNLRQAMRAGRFSPAEALAIVPKVCEALQYAHEQGVLHRDIKPENLLLDAKGRVKIADFGIAKLVGEEQPSVTLTNTGAALGTLHYMAPEQLEKPSTVDHRADIYSLGVVFYEMLTGELPIGRFSAPSSKTPVNASVDEVVFRTLEKDRERRFQSAGEMRTEVEHLGAGSNAEPTSTGAEQSPPVPPAPAWMKRLGVLFCVLGGAALLPTLFSLGSSQRVYHSGTLLAFTGVALLTRHGQWRMAAIVANLIGLVIPLASAINVMILSRNGTLPPGWSWGIPGVPNSAGLGVALSLVQMAAFAIGLWALLRPAARPHFLSAPYVPMGRVYSWWVIAGTALVGMSLPRPLSVVASMLAGRGGVGPADFWAALGSVAMPGLGGTLIGWLALNKIRESGGRERGLPLAMFATLTWPLILLSALVLGLPMLIVSRGERTLENMVGRFLVLLLPVGMIGFGIWLAQATKRWAGRKPAPHERGLLKWAFIAVVVTGMGVVMVAGPKRTAPGQPALEATDAAPWIRFTFTAVELREVKGVRWLAIDYLDDVHGDCGKAFPWESDIPGFTGHTRMSEFITDAKDSSPPVRHQRVEYKMPASAPREQLERLRENVEKALKQKSVRLELGENQVPLVLFELPGVEGGSFKAGIKVVPPLKIPTEAPTVTFEPEIEITVTNLFSSGTQLALDRKQAISLPPGAKQWGRTELLLWLAEEGVDLAAIYYDDDQYGWGFAMRQTTSRIDNRTWQTLDPQALENALARPDTGLERMDVSGNGMGLFRVYPRSIPLSFAVRTSQGRLAAMQITGFADNPPGVKIRYKLVKPAAAAPNLAPESKLVIDVWPGAYPAGVTPQPDKLNWKFKCLIPPGHLAQILFVRWTNGVPTIQQKHSAYYKVGDAPAEIDLHLSYDKHSSSQPAKERSQWNVNLGRGATITTFLPEEPTYVSLNTPGRMTVRSGRQRSVPLVDFADTSRLPSRGQNGIDLRILLMPLKLPAIRAVPTEQDHGNYISGMGLAGTMEEALKFLKELPTDP